MVTENFEEISSHRWQYRAYRNFLISQIFQWQFVVCVCVEILWIFNNGNKLLSMLTLLAKYVCIVKANGGWILFTSPRSSIEPRPAMQYDRNYYDRNAFSDLIQLFLFLAYLRCSSLQIKFEGYKRFVFHLISITIKAMHFDACNSRTHIHTQTNYNNQFAMDL